MDINAILIALGVVAGVGLVMGIVLALASKFFAVDEDEKVTLVTILSDDGSPLFCYNIGN